MSDQFNGFDPPKSNYFKVPNSYWDITDLTANQKHVLLYILRHTWGYQEFGIFKAMTIDEIQNGRKNADGSRMDAGTRFSRGSVHNHIKILEEKGYLEIETDDTDKARIKKSYRLNTPKSSVQILDTSVQNLDIDQRKTLKKDIQSKEQKEKAIAPVGATSENKTKKSGSAISPFNDTSYKGLFPIVAKQAHGFSIGDMIPKASAQRIGKDVNIIMEMSEPPAAAELTEMYWDWRTVTSPDIHVPVDGAKIVKALNLWRGSPGHRSYQNLRIMALGLPNEVLDLVAADPSPAPEAIEDIGPVPDYTDEELLAMMANLTTLKTTPSKKNAPPPRKASA